MYDYGRANKPVKLCLKIFTVAYVHIDQTLPPPCHKVSRWTDPLSPSPKRDIINERPRTYGQTDTRR